MTENKRDDVKEPYDRTKFGSLNNLIREVKSEGAFSSSNGNGNEKHISWSDDQLITPKSTCIPYQKLESDSDSYIYAPKNYKRRVDTVGCKLPSSYFLFGRKSTPHPDKTDSNLCIINTITKCNKCNEKINIIYSNVSYVCPICFDRVLLPIREFIIK